MPDPTTYIVEMVLAGLGAMTAAAVYLFKLWQKRTERTEQDLRDCLERERKLLQEDDDKN